MANSDAGKRDGGGEGTTTGSNACPSAARRMVLLKRVRYEGQGFAGEAVKRWASLKMAAARHGSLALPLLMQADSAVLTFVLEASRTHVLPTWTRALQQIAQRKRFAATTVLARAADEVAATLRDCNGDVVDEDNEHCSEDEEQEESPERWLRAALLRMRPSCLLCWRRLRGRSRAARASARCAYIAWCAYDEDGAR